MIKKLSGILGRLITFLLLTMMLAISLYFQHFTPPFSAIPSKSMEPTLKVGDLILINKISPTNIKVGDIIVVKVPTLVRDKYKYPTSIVHRVAKVEKSGDNLSFRMKGDNNQEEDPFTVLPEDLAGEVRRAIPNLGYPVLFLHSKQGMYFIISAIAIYLIYILMDWFSKKTDNVKKSLSSLFVGELIERTTVMEQKQEAHLKMVSQSLEKFSSAVEEYGIHLKSHTASVKGLAEGAMELKEAANKQNQILDQMNRILFDSSQTSVLDSLSARHTQRAPNKNAPKGDNFEDILGVLKNVLNDINTDKKEQQIKASEMIKSEANYSDEDIQKQKGIKEDSDQTSQSVKNELKNIIREIERINQNEKNNKNSEEKD